MEEAEVLCDRLGIFVDGSLQCISDPKEVIFSFALKPSYGNSTSNCDEIIIYCTVWDQLKARYGGSYIFTMTTDAYKEKEVESLAHRLSPQANKVYHISGTQKIELPKQDVRVADVFQEVESAKERFTVYAWGLADTTLEDVFIKVARDAHSFTDLS